MLIQTYTSLSVVIAPTIKQNNKYITKSPRAEAAASFRGDLLYLKYSLTPPLPGHSLPVPVISLFNL